MGKYKNKRAWCTLCNCNHDSRQEAQRCIELHQREARGEISDIRAQVEYELIPSMKYAGGQNNEREAHYTADFVYEENGVTVVEDVKSEYTRKLADYILRRKFFKARYCTGENPKMIFMEVR